MKYKKSIAMLSLVAVPAAITAIPADNVKATPQDEVSHFSESWVNPHFIYEGKNAVEKVAAIHAVAATTPIVATSYEELKAAVYTNLRQYNTEFSIKYVGDTSAVWTNIEKIYDEIIKDDTMIYESGTISKSEYGGSYTNAEASLTFKQSYHTTATQEQFVTKRVQEITKEIISSSMTDFEKIKAINDYVVLNTTYSTETNVSAHAAYAILAEGKGVCQAYALLAYRLFKEAGIEAKYVTGAVAGGLHAWNLAKLNGQWYHVDTTWNDPVFSVADGDMSDFVRYKYFLLSDTDIKKDHRIDDNGYPVATDNTYRSLHIVQTPVQVDSVLYFPNTDDNIQLYKVDLKNIAAGATKASSTRVKHLVVVNDLLYFSNYSNGGYLSKMKLDGTEQSIVKPVSIKSLKLDSNDLVYTTENNVTERIQIIDPEIENKAAAKIVSDLIAAIDETALNFIELVANARVAYDALTDGQKVFVTNVARLQQAEQKVQQENAAVNDVIQKIAQLNELDEQFHAKVSEARAAYTNLSTELKLRISNKAILETAEATVEANKVKALDVEGLINALNTTNAAYLAATTAARNAYDLLIAPQRNLISEATLQKLEAAEQQKVKDEEAVFEVNYQLELLTETAANFKTIVPEIRAKYEVLTAIQQTLVTKLSELVSAENTYKAYEQQGATLEASISALDEMAAIFAVDVKTVNDRYNSLNLAQQGFISAVSAEKLQNMVFVASENIDTAQAVSDKIAIINVTNTNFIAEVAAARAAYEVLTVTQQALVTNVATLETAEQVVAKIQDVRSKIDAVPETSFDLVANYDLAKTAYDALSEGEQQHVANISKLQNTATVINSANNVNQKIAALTAMSSATKIEEVRESYNILTSLAKELVTNVADLETAELRIKQEADQVETDTVIAQIDALQPVDASFIAKYEAAKTAYEALTQDQQAYVTNYADLVAVANDVIAVQEAIEAISTVEAITTYKTDAAVAQNKYDNLDASLQVAVTNAGVLTVIETNINAAEQVEQAISALTASASLEDINTVKASYAALTELQNQLVLNMDTIVAVENEMKAAAVEALIANLVEQDEASFVADVTKAREAYDALTDDQQMLVTNVLQLEVAETRVAEIARSNQKITNVIQLIAKINDTAANFQSTVEEAEQAYNDLMPEQQAKVTTAAEITAHEKTIADYADIAVSFESQVTSIDTASVTFIADVETAQNHFVAFNAAQLTFIAASTKARLEQYTADIAVIREVDVKLLSLNTFSPAYYTEVAEAHAAYAELSSDYKQFISVQAMAKLDGAIAHVEADKAAAQNVADAIATLTTASSEASVKTTRAQYNALTANQKQLVTNVAKLVEVEAMLANRGSDSGSTGDSSSGNGSSSIGGGSSSDSESGSTGGGNSSGSGSSSSGGGSSSGSGSNSSGGGSSSGSGSSSSGGSTTGNNTTQSTGNDTTTNNEASAQPTVQVGDNGTSHSVVVPPATEVGNAQPLTITMSENMRITIPQTAIPTAANTASIAMTVDVSDANVIQFKATVDDAPVKFSTYIEFEVADLPNGAVILRRDDNGNLSAVPFTVADGKYVIKTRTSGEFVVSTVNVTFGDVAKDGHKEYIDELAKRHIVTGVDAENFDPNAGMTRAQFSAMIARAMNLEAENETNFEDVRGKWYEASVQALVEAGIVKGKSEETFDPGQTITRQQTSVMVERLLKYAGVELPQADLENVPFTDFDKVPANYQSSVALMYQLGIFTGKNDGSFDASGELTRSQMTKVLYKALQLAGML